MKDFESLSGEEVGHLLEGFGINMLVSNVGQTVKFLVDVLEFSVLRSSGDYAVLEHRDRLYQLHGDPTYSDHPLLSVIPESGLRGGGVELRLFDMDPDLAEQRAVEHGYTILQATADKPHGLRECFLLDPDGYCWVPSKKIPGTSN
jgi:hypothetical protein